MGQHEQLIEGLALTGSDLEPRAVRICVEDGRIHRIEDLKVACGRWICPHFWNSHTHTGDTVAMDTMHGGDLTTLVTPPDGLKHRILKATPVERLKGAMRSSLISMTGSGTAGCADFREGGVIGVQAFRDASRDLPLKTVVFGRDGGESIADGLGISSTRDVPDAARFAEDARRMGKLVAVHAGERDRGDIPDALSLSPDLIIHFTHASREDIAWCADRQVPVTVCARSNWTLGVAGSSRRPPLEEMIESGCKLLIGTDNVMFVQPDLFSEMQFISFVYGIEPREILRSAVRGFDVFREPNWIEEGNIASFFWIETGKTNFRYTHDPVATLVRRGSAAHISGNVFSLH
jgi:cytosine/adenosine deaminase-related metal-dependent hydrolase